MLIVLTSCSRLPLDRRAAGRGGGIAVGFPVTVWGLGELSQQLGVVVPRNSIRWSSRCFWASSPTTRSSFCPACAARLAQGDDRLEATRATTAEFTPIIVTSAVILEASLLALAGLDARLLPRPGPRARTHRWRRPGGRGDAHPGAHGDVRRRRLLAARAAVKAPETRRAPSRSGRLISSRWIAVPTVVVCLAALGVAAWQLQSLRLGFGQISDLPSDSPPKVGRAGGRGRLCPGILSPTTIVVEQRGIADGRRGRLVRMQALVGDVPGVAATLGPRDQPTPARARGRLRGQRQRRADRRDLQPRAARRRRASPTSAGCGPRCPGSRQTSGLGGARISYAGDTALAATRSRTSTTQHVAGRPRVRARESSLLLIVFLRSLTAPLFLLGSSVIAVAAVARAHCVGLPVGAGLRPADVLRAVRGLGAADLAGLGLQHLRGRQDLAGGHASGRFAKLSRSQRRRLARDQRRRVSRWRGALRSWP